MNTIASQSIQSVIAELRAQNLELAPEGWRQCVEKVAEGYAEVVGGHTYCLNCDGVLHGAQGHHIHCATMVARRILANESVLQSRLALDPFDGDGRDHRAKRPWKPSRRTARTRDKSPKPLPVPDVEYVVPTFLTAARSPRNS
jgi:hypothetical protein